MIQNIFMNTFHKNKILAIATIFAAVLVMGGNLTCAKESDEAECADGQIIIVLDDAGLSEKKSDRLLDNVQDDLSDQLDAEMTSTLVENSDDQGTVGLVEVPESTSVAEAVEEAEALDGVAYAQPNYIYHTSETVNDPDVEEECYYLEQTHVPEAWDLVKTESSVQVAVLDTGCRLKHEDLVNNINQDLACDVYQTEVNYSEQNMVSLPDNPNWVLLENRYEDSDDQFSGDGDGHGTHVCGLIAAEANNNKGIAGTSYNAKILPVKVFDDYGNNTYTSTLVKGCQYVIYCIDQEGQSDIKIVNMSLAAAEISDPLLESQISSLRNDYGVLTVAAGGNFSFSYDSKADTMIPSDYPECLSVVSVDEENCLSDTSMYNEHKDIAAPGVNIYSTYNKNDSSYRIMSGTSMSTPIVSGICALLWAHDPDMTVDDVVEAVCSTTTDFVEEVDAGASGVINAKAALEYDSDGKTIDLSQFAELSISEGESVTYSEEGNKPDVYVFGKLLTEGEDYSLTIASGDTNKVGDVSLTITGMGKYTGSLSLNYKIVMTLSSSTIKVVLSNDNPVYDGTKKQPLVTSVTLKSNSSVKLEEGTDYKITSCSNNINASTEARFTIKGLNCYQGTATYKFTIDPRKISNASQKYTKTAYTGNETSLKLTDLDADLVEGTDFTADYTENDRINVGTVNVLVTGQGNYTGTASYSYRIANPIRKVKVVSTVFAYTGKTISMKLKFGSVTLKEGRDYKIAYSNSKDVGMGVAVITGMGDYGGKASITYKINPKATKFTQKNSYRRGLRVKWYRQTTQTDGYQLQIATTKAFTNPKTYTMTNTKVNYKTLRNLSAKKTYYVRVRTYKVVNNHKYYSSWSDIAAIKTK